MSRSEPVKRALTVSKFLKKHFVRGAAFGVLPAAINDVAVHHAQLSVNELIHVTVDTVTVSSINTVANILMVASKLPL
jgi:hypothetical protein